MEGDQTEGALYPFASEDRARTEHRAAARRRIDTIPFESEHKFMATLNKDAGGNQIYAGQGRPGGIILDHCDRQASRRTRGC